MLASQESSKQRSFDGRGSDTIQPLGQIRIDQPRRTTRHKQAVQHRSLPDHNFCLRINDSGSFVRAPVMTGYIRIDLLIPCRALP